MNSGSDSGVMLNALDRSPEDLSSVLSSELRGSGFTWGSELLVRGLDEVDLFVDFMKGGLDGHVVMDLLGRGVEDPS